jgi:DNA-binding transcriptional ArsR family regulator
VRSEGHLPLPPLRRSRERLAVVRTFLKLVDQLHDLYLDSTSHGLTLESVVIAATIFLGHVEGRPFNTSKLAHYTKLSRTTVRRKMQPLLKGKVVERRRDGTFAMCEPRANSDAVLVKVNRIINVLSNGVLEVQTASTVDTRAEAVTVGLPERELTI